MASAVQSLRLCLRACSRASAPRRIVPRQRMLVATRPISTTPVRRRQEEEDDLEEEEGEEEKEEEEELDEETAAYYRNMSREEYKEMEESLNSTERDFNELDEFVSTAMKPPPIKMVQKTFWGEDEEDPDMMTENADDDDFSEDDITSMAHGKLDEYREHREYARIAVWQMPLLSKLARPFEPPSAEQCLRFRYTSYMGETHPAQNKVVVEFSPKDMPLSEPQKLKLKKLLGARWNPETDVAKMSCEQFGHQAQNKRYLGDLVAKLIAQARDPTDMFEDVPLDTRHHKFKVKPKFPVEWRLTEERRKTIEDTRQKSLLLDQAREEVGAIVDGKAKVEQFFNASPESAELRIPEVVTQRLGPAPSRPLPRSRGF